MKKNIKTSIVISTTPEKVWSMLTNFKNYPNWNPFIVSIEGKIAENEKLKISIIPPNEKGMKFKPTIIELIKNKKLTWKGKLLFSGIFDGKHSFELIDNKDGTTTFNHSELFTGFLVKLLSKKLDNGTKKGFILMNKKLKQECEK